MKRRDSAPVEVDSPGPFVLKDWLSSVDDGVEPMLRPVYARKLWDAAWAEWGRRNGYRPDVPYVTTEGRRWHLFRQGHRA